MEGIFERVEYKYILTPSRYERIMEELNKHFEVDAYGETTIQSLYFDTDDYILVRRSIERPLYKEKMRLRSYGLSDDETKVYLEVKKKFKGIVYKRRVKILEKDVDALFNKSSENLSQIERELVYFSKQYAGIKPKMLVLYDRTAMVGKDSDIRLTFDKNLRYRSENLNLHTDLTGTNMFDSGEIIMELKTTSPFPLWLCKLLSDNQIYKTSFSKYGTAYSKTILSKTQKEAS